MCAITVKHEYTAQQFYNKYNSSTGYYAYQAPYSIVNFNGNGGTPSKFKISAIPNVKLTSGGSLPTAARAGYTFAGWSETVNGSSIGSNFAIQGNKILYAIWVYGSIASIPFDEIIIYENDMSRIISFLNKEKEE